MQIVLAVGREDVRLSFREDIQVVVILLGDLLIEGGVWGGKGGGEGGGREGGEVAARMGWVRGGGERQVVEQKGEGKVRVPACQSMRGLCRANHGKPNTSRKCASLVT